MQKIIGNYGLNDSTVKQLNYQITPFKFKEKAGYKLPISGPFTVAIAQHGEAILYSSVSGEIPLYYGIKPKRIYWAERKRDLPADVNAWQVAPGKAVVWNIKKGISTVDVEAFPRPPIQEKVDLEDAIDEYSKLLLLAVERRLQNTTGKIAVSCSGGVDSLLVTWALLKLNAEIVPFTACLRPNSPDVKEASITLQQLGAPPTTPILITKEVITNCLPEALVLYGDLGPTPKYMQQATCHVAIARACKDRKLTTIFNGHGQDDIQGGLRGIYKELYELPDTIENAEFWRDERQRAIKDQQLMWDLNKLFSVIFREYGVNVQMPYYDGDLLEWAFSQPLNIIPISKNKPFIRKVAQRLLPPGSWSTPSYVSTGYTKGTGWEDPQCKELKDYLKLYADVSYSKL